VMVVQPEAETRRWFPDVWFSSRNWSALFKMKEETAEYSDRIRPLRLDVEHVVRVRWKAPQKRGSRKQGGALATASQEGCCRSG
jgi:hypothetical protein